MSITKFENSERKLISQEDIDLRNLSAKSSQCSCTGCDTVRCIEKRRKADKDYCQCGTWKDLKNCCTLNAQDSHEKKDPENTKKKILREVVTRQTIESLKTVTETMYEFDTKQNFGITPEKRTKPKDVKLAPTPTISQISTVIENSKKRSIGDSDINDNKKCCKQHSILQVPSIDASQPDKDTTTKLSALVMNVPYDDLREAVPSSHKLTEKNPLSKLNIFKRIKEIYEACSCKVCECISNKPRDFRDDFCNCKPCQCEDCVKTKKNIEEKIRRIPHSGCPCIRCDRKDCRGIVKNASEPQSCDCNPSDIDYTRSLSRQCKCEPCQCISCRLLNLRTSKAVKLGEVDDYIRRETCQCSPCECIECKQIYNRTNPTIMCTHSTGKTRYRNYCRCSNCLTEPCQMGEIEVCRCEKYNRATRKTFDNNYKDYDIHTVIIDSNGPFNQQKECQFAKQNNVALFASLTNNYPSNSCNKNVCKCSDCECIVCSAKDKNYRENLKHNVMSLHNNILPTSITNACKCTPCECEVCYKKGDHEDNIALQSKCRCDVCDCLNCDITSSFPVSPIPTSSFTPCRIKDNLPTKPIKILDMNKTCNCNSCDCSNCKKLFSCSSSVKFYSNGKSVDKKTTRRLRKVMLITPSTSESRLKSRTTCIRNVSSTSLSPKHPTDGVFRQDLSTCRAISNNYPAMNHFSNTNRDQICSLYEDHNKPSIISEDNIDRDPFLKLNNLLQDNESFKSIEESSILSYPCEIPSCYKNHDKLNEPRSKIFNLVHEQPDKITSKDSEELLPVFWPYCRETLHPRSFSRNNLNETLCHRLNEIQNKLSLNNVLENKQDDLNEKDEGNSIQLNFGHKCHTKSRDIFSEYIKYSDYDGTHNYSCNDERINPYRATQKFTDSFNSIIKNSHQKYKKSNNIVSHSDITIDYERATRILNDAKAFSSKLIKMLDSFETANRQFESASQKFKVLHESLIDMNASEVNKSSCSNLGRMSIPIFDNTFDIIPEVHENNTQSKDLSEKNENEAERDYEQSIIKPKDICNNAQNTKGLTPSNCFTFDVDHIHKSTDKINDMNSEENKTDTVNCSGPKPKSNLQSEPEKTLNVSEISCTSKTLHMHVFDSTHLVSSQTDVNNDSKNKIENVDNVINAPQTPITTIVIEKVNSICSDTINQATNAATDDREKNLIELLKQNKRPWQMFKKNLYLDARPNDKRSIFQSPALELDIKEAIQAISLQTTNDNYTAVLPKPNEALANLQSEVSNLLNMPLLQKNAQFMCKTEQDARSFPRSKLDLELKSMSTTASSQTYNPIVSRADKEVYFNINSEPNKVTCEELKANFVGLRRVSDHTVLVKWNVPKRIADVQGYEVGGNPNFISGTNYKRQAVGFQYSFKLLVDGRAVQKILSPTRSMAVVTCLPHAARVLLTIRTIASADCGHAPTTSMVYRPRMK